MAGSEFGRLLKLTTWGESHGPAIGAVLDGIPAGLALDEADIQKYLDRRRPGSTTLGTARREDDQVEILSGVYEGRTTGTPISLMIRNSDAHSGDYRQLAELYRPGHADMGFDMKYGHRDPRGGGRSSGRETAARVAAGAIAVRLLSELGIEICSYVRSIGPVCLAPGEVDPELIGKTLTLIPHAEKDEEAQRYLEMCRAELDSVGGSVVTLLKGVPAGIGDPVFDKLDARFAQALMSIGAVKAVEVGDGVSSGLARGSENNDAFRMEGGRITTVTNHCGGILGGISTGGEIVLTSHFKPTPSIAREQETVTTKGESIRFTIVGRHDPIIVVRAAVVTECMCALTLLDAMMSGAVSRMDALTKLYPRKGS